MTTLLHIDTSARPLNQSDHQSISRTLAQRFLSLWQNTLPETHIIYRDLATSPVDLINQAWIEAAFTKEEKRTPTQMSILSASNELIDEVMQADIILLSTPMYNYGMPAVLKAWFDQVIRVNKTFSFDLNRGDFPLQASLSGKTLILITSSGEYGFELGGLREKMDHLHPHIHTLSHYLGVETMHTIRAEYQEFNDERHQASLKKANTEVITLVAQLVDITQATFA
ncbi:FMN-dependent NADH-azoreductase [Shewanella surugensis]|uniref:FMN dependent NADH:quinone oxidoreductase n=1 Tax=Shewanella surugensis TaxID=212020 RepID=A0ABT0LJI5_9GAMM|nr:NAD(P)H-dependent oxidoreductase [Shewanella surugensis]MCL1127749.1 NAD(P)H-dependent oxidoreductase [Shewanella surugensis]